MLIMYYIATLVEICLNVFILQDTCNENDLGLTPAIPGSLECITVNEARIV